MPSYSQPDPFTRLRGQMTRAGIPFTLGLILVNAVLFLVDYFGGGVVEAWLGLRIVGHLIWPLWGVLTFPLITPGFIPVIFGCLFFFFIGGSLERSWGTARFAGYMAACTLVTSLSVWIGSSVLHEATLFIFPGLWLVISPLVVTWATLNPRQSVMMYMVLPVPAWALAAFEVGYVYFIYFAGHFLLGLFGLIPCALAFVYATGNWSYAYRGYAGRGPDLRISRSAPRRQTSVLDGSRPAGGPMGWLRAWQERRRLRKLWRDSGFGD